MTFLQLIDSLFQQGLGELPVFYKRINGVYLGNMVYEKGRLFFKDRGILSGLEEDLEYESWEKNILGMVCYKKHLQWESLTFYGIDHCNLATDIDPELQDSLMDIKNQYGDRLFDFIGSIYRAYQLLVDHDYLPVILMQPVTAQENTLGLAIGDLSSIVMQQDIKIKMKHMIREAVANHESIELV